MYWVGPIAGGIAAALLYSLFFSAPAAEVQRSDKYRQVQQNDDKEVSLWWVLMDHVLMSGIKVNLFVEIVCRLCSLDTNE